jgi:hypothetical protein
VRPLGPREYRVRVQQLGHGPRCRVRRLELRRVLELQLVRVRRVRPVRQLELGQQPAPGRLAQREVRRPGRELQGRLRLVPRQAEGARWGDC